MCNLLIKLIWCIEHTDTLHVFFLHSLVALNCVPVPSLFLADQFLLFQMVYNSRLIKAVSHLIFICQSCCQIWQSFTRSRGNYNVKNKELSLVGTLITNKLWNYIYIYTFTVYKWTDTHTHTHFCYYKKNILAICNHLFTL